MPLVVSDEQKRVQSIIDANPEGTRKGDDARSRMTDIMKNRSKEEQRQAGKGQFIRAEKTRRSLKDRVKAQRRQ